MGIYQYLIYPHLKLLRERKLTPGSYPELYLTTIISLGNVQSKPCFYTNIIVNKKNHWLCKPMIFK